MQANKKRVAPSGRVGPPTCRGGAVPGLAQRERRQKGGTAKGETQRARPWEALHVRHTRQREWGRRPPANCRAAAFSAAPSRPPSLPSWEQIWTTHPNRRAPLCALSDAGARRGHNRPRPPSPIFGRAVVRSQPNRRCGALAARHSTPAHTLTCDQNPCAGVTCVLHPMHCVCGDTVGTPSGCRRHASSPRLAVHGEGPAAWCCMLICHQSVRR